MKARLNKHARQLGLALIVGLIGFACWHGYKHDIGEPSERLADNWHTSHRVIDRNGQLLRELPSDAGLRGRHLELEQVGERLLTATLVSEDKRFYQHSGVDLQAATRALGDNIRHRRIVSGASTITQQLVKILDSGGGDPGPRTVAVKVREAARAENLEQELSKEEILEAYMNRLNYGRNLVGPAAAAHAFFGVDPRELSWAQAALLAVLPRGPSFLDPYTHRDRAVKRQRELLDALAEAGFIDEFSLERALAEPIVLRTIETPFEAPHLVEALRGGSYGGLSADLTETTIDLELQRDVAALLDSHRARLAERDVSNAAALVIDNRSGEVLAYVGSMDFNDEAIAGQVDLVRARRQPGSSLKSFVYAMAFEHGRVATGVVADVPTRFNEAAGQYAPRNFRGVWEGPISLREALAGSLNIPVVRLMAELPAGAPLERLRALGMASLDQDAAHYGLALSLGAGEVTLFELAGAYVALSRGGEAIDLSVTKQTPPVGRQVFDPSAAAQVSEILSDPLARVRGLGGRGPFEFDFPVALKTGTSSGYRDSWTVGYTHERTVAIWVGNADGSGSDEVTGGSGAGPVFTDVMRRSMDDVPSRQPLYDDALLATVAVCPLSGRPAAPACPHVVRRRVIAQHVAEAAEACSFHRHAAAGPRCDPDGPATIVVLPDEYAEWLAAQPAGAPGQDAQGLSWYLQRAVPGCGEVGLPELRIDAPADGAVHVAAGRSGTVSRLELLASVHGLSRVDHVEFLIDGQVVATSAAPFRALVPIESGDHSVEVRPRDAAARVKLARHHFSVR